MLKNASPHFNLCICYIYPVHTCIAQSTATRKIVLDAILSTLNFAVLKWRASVNSGLYRRYTSWINTDKPFVSLVHTAQWHHYCPWRVQHAHFRLLCTYLGVCSSWRSKQLRPSATWECTKNFTEVSRIASKNKPQATKFSDHRAISLIAHTTKIVAKILRRRMEKKIEVVLGEDQFGFRRGKGTRNAIGMLRIIS